MSGSKTLDEYFGGKAEAIKSVETAEAAKAIEEVTPRNCNVYLTASEAFNKYCKECKFLVKVEDTGSAPFNKRIFCSAEECMK